MPAKTVIVIGCAIGFLASPARKAALLPSSTIHTQPTHAGEGTGAIKKKNVKLKRTKTFLAIMAVAVSATAWGEDASVPPPGHENTHESAQSGSHYEMDLKKVPAAIAARLKKLHEQIANCNDGILRGMPDWKTLSRHQKSYTALTAAGLAAEAGAFDDAEKYLVLSERRRNYDDALKQIHALKANPGSVDARITFIEAFWQKCWFGGGSTEESETRLMALDVLQMNPTADQRLKLYQLIFRASRILRDAATASEYMNRICVEFPDRAEFWGQGFGKKVAVCDAVLYEFAQWFSETEPAKGREALERIIKHPTGGLADEAHIALAGMARDGKDEVSMIKHLEQAIKLPPVGEPPNDVSVRMLGGYYQEKKEFAKALEYYRAWVPQGDCGNGLAADADERTLRISQCLVALGREEEAIKQLLSRLTTDDEFEADTTIAALTVELYERKNDLEGLIKIVRPHTENEYQKTANIALTLAEIRLERRDSKIPALITRLYQSGNDAVGIYRSYGSWEARAVTQALSEFGGTEFPALKKQYELLMQQKKVDENHCYDQITWVIYAIGMSKADAAGTFLKDLLKKGKESGDTSVGTDAAAIEHVLAQRELRMKPLTIGTTETNTNPRR